MSDTWADLWKINAVAVLLTLLVFLAGACGTGIGNPEAMDTASDGAAIPLAGESLDFQAPIDAYNADTSPSCGSFTSESPSVEVDAGRNCIHQAFAACSAARYLLDQTLEDGSRFVSYVAIVPPGTPAGVCELTVHTVSTDISRFLGDAQKSCPELAVNEQIELACGITE